MSDTVGSIRKFSIEGISFRIAADSNFSKTLAIFENDMIATSGDAMRKMTKRVTAVEGVVFIVNGADIENLKSFSEQIEDLQFQYTTAGGDTYRSVGAIELESVETEEGRVNGKVMPRQDWTAYID